MRLKNTRRPPANKKNVIIIAGLVVLGLVILRSFLTSGFPHTHDSFHHLARLANLNLAFHDRHFPFRWAGNLNHGFGLPIFNFYYYLLELLAFIPMKLGLSIETSLKLVVVLAYLGAAGVWYWWLKDKFGRLAAAAAGVFSLTAVYPLSVILIRGAYGETLAYFLLVLNFYLLERFCQKPTRWRYLLAVLGLSAFLLSHNISVIFGLPLLFFKYRKAFWVFLNAVGLSLFFWLPLVFERGDTYFNSIQSQAELLGHFPTLTQLIYMPWDFGLSVPGAGDTMSFSLGPVHWLIICLAFAAKPRGFFHWAFLAFLFLALPVSGWLWRLFPVLNFVQFPWRLVLFLSLTGSYLAAVAGKFYPKITAVLLAAAVILTVVTVHDQGHFNWPDEFYFHYPFTTTTQLEAMPKWFDAAKNAQLFGRSDKQFSLSGQAVKLDQVVWQTQKHSYQVTIDEADQLFERTAYFPGWQVTVDGQKQEIIKDNQTYPGLVGFNVPAGSHQIVSQFSDSTPARRVGDAAALFSVLLLIVITWYYPKLSKLLKSPYVSGVR
jgi:hypothetical protein